MKVWTIAFASLAVGAVAGAGTVWVELGAVEAPFRSAKPAAGSGGKKGPEAVVPETEHNFGVGQRNSKMEHTFVIRNAGDEALTLDAGNTTCKCTISNLENGQVAPGDSAEVKVEWKLNTLGTNFRQTAEIRTNDEQKPMITLTIAGKIVDHVKLDPRDLVLTSVSANAGAATDFYVFAYEQNDIEVTSFEFADEKTAAYFDLSFQEVSESTLSEEDGATSGLRGTLRVKPGLPLGPINQTIRLTTNVDAVGRLELDVAGSVVSDISIVGGSDYSQKRSILDLGTIDVGRGKQRDLRILVKGPHRQATEFTIKEVDPDDVLDASLGDAQPINRGAVVMHKLNIQVRQDARAVNRLGTGESEYGKIMIETTHPDTELIPIYVKFSVR
jgi:hypothetical protein